MNVNEALLKIDLKDNEGFKNIFLNLKNENKKQLAAELAHKLLFSRIPEILQPIPYRERYEFILTNLKEVYPSIRTYFARTKNPGEGLYKVSISTKGQRAIAEEMKERLEGKTIDVCDNFDVFEKKLSNLIKEKIPQEKTFTLRHRRLSAPKNLTSHTSAIHIVSHQGKIQVFITDSIGRDDKWIANMIASIKAVYAKSDSKTPIEINYYAGPKLQVDHTNCIVFALRYAALMVRNSKDVINWVTTHRTKNEDGTFSVFYLPLGMMKTCQSLSYIQYYLNETKQKDVLLHSKKEHKQEGETLDQGCQKHYTISVDHKTKTRKLQNSKIATTYLKYERHIIATAILNSNNE